MWPGGMQLEEKIHLGSRAPSYIRITYKTLSERWSKHEDTERNRVRAICNRA